MKSKTTTLAAKARTQLLDRLLNQELRPGDMINRRDIAAQLNMSVAPVLEAMVRLESEGFLETLPRKGTRVRVVHPDAVRGQMIVREALECEAARFYCGKPVKASRQGLLVLAQELDQSPPAVKETWLLEMKLHTALVDLADCPALSNHFKRLMLIRLFYRLNLVQAPQRRVPISKHATLIRKLEKADADEAEALIRAHIRAGKDPVLELNA